MVVMAEETTANSIRYVKAGFVPRLCAFLVDYVVIILVSAVLGYFAGIIGVVLSFFAPVLYCGFFYQKYSSTPGKKAFGMKVVKTDSGEKPDYMDAFLRDGLGKTISGVIFCIGYLMVLFREDKQALHDMLAKTTVLKEG